MHLPKIYSFLHDLKHPGMVWDRRLLGARIRTFLDGLPGWQGALHLRFVGRGSYSMAYSFVLSGKEFVIRISSDVSVFTRDSFASRYADIFPVPRVFEMGEFEKNRYYAISERSSGRQIDTLNKRSALRVIPLMFETLEHIHLADVSGSDGYGVVDAAGNGISPGWKEFLLYYDRNRQSEQWGREMPGTFIDHQLYDDCLERMASLIPFCPEDRCLVHGDFSFSDVLSNGKQITGVVDWQHCLIGDALFDFAKCYYWYCTSPRLKVWLEMIVQTQRGSVHFDERFRCYMLKSAIEGLINAVRERNMKKCRHRSIKTQHVLRMLDKPIETWNRFA
jgi:hygromycin-B 4-O-kinase